MELNESEYEAFLKLSNNLCSDEPTKKLCLQYYLEYKAVLSENKLQTLSEDKVQVAMRCAFFLSEKSQVMYNVRGEKIRGVSLSLTQTLKSHNNLDEFVFFLKDIIRKIHLEDAELEAEINHFIKRFCFILTFYNKFESVFKKLEFQEREPKQDGPRDYLRTLMSFGWLIFIDSKARVFKNSFEIIDVTCLMVSVFRFIVTLAGDYARSQMFFDLEREAKNPREYKEMACQQLLEQFKIRDLKMFEHINSHFENYVNNTLLNDFRYSSGSDILSPNNISTNYKKLDTTYQKTLSDPEDIDERYFLKERVTITPSRFTPFGGRGTATKWKKQNFNSQRILNYELDETMKENAPAATPSTPSVQTPALKFPKNFTPTMTKPPVIFSTPMTQAMEMYNWIAEKPKRQKNSPSFEKTVDKIMALEKKGSDPKSKENRKRLIQYLYEDCLAGYPLGDEDPALLCWAIEAVYYILNLPGIPINKMVELADVEWYHLWRVTDYFLKYDKNMPNALKMHILDIETRVVSMELWRQETDLINIFSPGQAAKLTKKYAEADRFTRRVLHQLAYQIHLLTGPLSLSEQLANTVLTTVQHILSTHASMLIAHHLDQLVLCSIYSLSKVVGLNLKFNEIILKYREVNGYTKEIYNEIIEQVQTDGRKEDIIAFYNHNFIPTMKSYMIEVKGQKGIPNQPTGYKPPGGAINLLGSPIKSLIPKQLLNLRTNTHMTPQTQMLYAYNESPLLRGDHLMDSRSPTGNFLPSKKLLNFEAELEQTNRKKPFQKPDSFADIQDATNDFINKKFNAKKKENIIQNGDRPEGGTLVKQGSGYFKVEDKLMRLKSKDKL